MQVFPTVQSNAVSVLAVPCSVQPFARAFIKTAFDPFRSVDIPKTGHSRHGTYSHLTRALFSSPRPSNSYSMIFLHWSQFPPPQNSMLILVGPSQATFATIHALCWISALPSGDNDRIEGSNWDGRPSRASHPDLTPSSTPLVSWWACRFSVDAVAGIGPAPVALRHYAGAPSCSQCATLQFACAHHRD